MRRRILPLAFVFLLVSCARVPRESEPIAKIPEAMHRSEERVTELNSSSPSRASTPELTSEQQYILYEEGTERPFSSPLLNEHRAGTFVAADTGEPLFRSEAKYDSGTGWPSFTEPISPDAVVLKNDTSLWMERTEVMTKNGSHLGHVFDDGPEPTGKRYCINGLALRFVPDEK